MAKKKAQTKEPRRRDREGARREILAALERLFVRTGFARPGVNALARESGFNKTLIYRYFGDLSGVIREYAGGVDFWPDLYEAVSGQPAPDGRTYETFESLPLEMVASILAAPLVERVATALYNLIEGLRRRPQTVEIMARETVERNELTAILEEVRERRGLELMRVLINDPHLQKNSDETRVGTVIAPMLAGSLFYLLIRSRKIQFFGGIDIQSEEGWADMHAAVREVCERVFAEPTEPR